MVKTIQAFDRAAARRTAILSIASDVFLREGYSGAAMSDIAEQLGGSKGTLYNYFPSKKDLFFAVVQDRAEQALDEFDTVVTSADLESALREMARRNIRNVLSYASVAFYRLLISEAARFPEIGTLFYTQLRARFVSPLAPHLLREVDAQRLGFVDHLEAGEFFYDLCVASLHRRALMGIALDLDEDGIDAQADRAVSMFLKICGLGKRSARSGQTPILHVIANPAE